ncbi:hypothetical protein CRG98_020826 [Punica granatum]|uniref:Uncharacterized protein n=1 Tax=Punica granatum TaxID=22663 RepID=A0A2I0JR30_PUNGR|nr:hypothetical protein CRG98_020826 [Punica granatum]
MDPVKKERVERRLCTVDRPSNCDHLFTGGVWVMGDPSDVMARLGKVVGGNGKRRRLDAPGGVLGTR